MDQNVFSSLYIKSKKLNLDLLESFFNFLELMREKTSYHIYEIKIQNGSQKIKSFFFCLQLSKLGVAKNTW